jgi:hypothetical protein
LLVTLEFLEFCEFSLASPLFALVCGIPLPELECSDRVKLLLGQPSLDAFALFLNVSEVRVSEISVLEPRFVHHRDMSTRNFLVEIADG